MLNIYCTTYLFYCLCLVILFYSARERHWQQFPKGEHKCEFNTYSRIGQQWAGDDGGRERLHRWPLTPAVLRIKLPYSEELMMHLRSNNIGYRISHTSDSVIIICLSLLSTWDVVQFMSKLDCCCLSADYFFFKLESVNEFWTNKCMVNEGENVIKQLYSIRNW